MGVLADLRAKLLVDRLFLRGELLCDVLAGEASTVERFSGVLPSSQR